MERREFLSMAAGTLALAAAGLGQSEGSGSDAPGESDGGADERDSARSTVTVDIVVR